MAYLSAVYYPGGDGLLFCSSSEKVSSVTSIENGKYSESDSGSPEEEGHIKVMYTNIQIACK